MSATTFRPPSTPAAKPAAKPAGKKKNLLVPVLGVVCAALAGASGFFFTQVQSKTAGMNTLNEGLLAIAGAAGSGSVAAEDLAQPAAAGEALQRLAQDVQALVTGGEAARADAERQRVEIANLTGRLDAESTKLGGVQRQLTTANEELTAARKQTEELQAKYDTDMNTQQARVKALTADVDALKRELAAAAENVPAEEGAPVVETDVAVVAEVPPTEAGDEESAPPARPSEFSMVIPPGASQLFKTVRFETDKNRLTFVTMNDTKLVYSKVPQDMYDGLAAAPVLDIFYRFKIFDIYESNPKDLDVLRELRRN